MAYLSVLNEYMRTAGFDSALGTPLIRAADQDEFQAFASACSAALLRTAYLLLRDRDAAEDALQITLLRTFRRWGRAKARPEAYSRRVLINVCRDQRRERGRLPGLRSLHAPDATDDDIASSACSTAGVELRSALQQALGTLPEQQREVLVLRFYLDLSVAETARLLRIPEGTVKSATHRGLAAMQGLIAHEANDAA